MAKAPKERDEDRAPAVEPSEPAGTRRTRTETVDHAAILKAVTGAFEAGGSAARSVVDSLNSALQDERKENARLHSEIARLHGSHAASFEKQQDLVTTLRTVAGQNIALTLAEGQGKRDKEEVIQKGENLRHGMSLLATNPMLTIVLTRLLPGLNVTPSRPPGEGNTPREAAERFAAALRSGTEGTKVLLDMLATYCEEEETLRAGDLVLLLEFFAGAMGGAEPAPAEQKTEVA